MVEKPSQFCEVAGHQIAYQRYGAGETVLLVHGITTYSFIWRKLIPGFSQHYDVIAMDLLGSGNSDKPLDESYSIRRQTELIYKFLQQLGIQRFHFVGHDIGGGVGQVFAVQFTKFLFDLTVINTVAYDYWPVQPIQAIHTPIIRQLMMAALDLGAFKLIVMHGVYHKDRVDETLMELFSRPMRTREGRKAFLHFAKCLDNRDLMEIAPRLQSLNLPVLIIRGEDDLYLNREIAKRLHREIPNSRLEQLPRAGHFIQEDQPELLVEIITQFFKETHHDNEKLAI